MNRTVTRGYPDETTKQMRLAKMAAAAAETREALAGMREADALLADLSKATSSETITAAGFAEKSNQA